MSRRLLLPLLLLAALASMGVGEGVGQWRPPQYTTDPGSMVNVRDFGAVGDGVADDTAEIQAAMDSVALAYATSTGDGNFVFVPPGIYLISTTINVPNGVILSGAGASSSSIKADAAFPLTSTPMITLADEATGVCSKTQLRDLNIDANTRAELAVSTDCINEHSGIRDVTIRRLVEDGILIANTLVPNNFFLENIDLVYASAPTATSVGIDLGGAPQFFNAVTVNGANSANAASIGIRIDSGAALVAPNGYNIHLERWGTGILVDDQRSALFLNITCASTVAVCMQITTNNQGFKLLHMFHDHADGAANTIVDTIGGLTLTDRSISQYFVGHGTAMENRNLVIQSSGTGNVARPWQSGTSTGIICAAAYEGAVFYDTNAGAAGTADDGRLCVCNDDVAQGYIWRDPSTPTTELTGASTTDCGT